jgi:DNA segregation ATPase FtsK/SpoIIIE-like protein
MHTARVPHRHHRQRTDAVAALMRLVGRLTADAAGDARRLQAHRHYVAGYLTALEATGVLPHPQLLQLQRTCEVLLEGSLTLQDITAMKHSGNGNASDPTYLRAVTLVNRARVADAAALASQLDTSTVIARRLIERMQADGLVGEPDLFGIHPLKAAEEVRHG